MKESKRDTAPPVEEELAKLFKPHAQTLNSLRNRILVQLLFVALIPLILLALYLTFQFTKTLEDRTEVLLRTIAKGRQASIDQLISNKINALKSVSKFINPETPPSNNEMTNLLGLLQGMDATILDIGLFDDQGTHIRYAGDFQFLEGKNYSEENWFQVLSKSVNDIFINDVYLGYRKEPHFAIAYRFEAGMDTWFLRITINPVRFNQLVSDVQVIEGARAMIVANDGVCQCGPEALCTSFAPIESLPVMNDRQGLGRMRIGGASFLAAWSKMQTADWTLVVMQDQAVANLPVASTSRVVLIFLLFSGFLIIIFSLLSTRRLLRRYARAESDRSRLIDQLFQAGKLGTMGEMAAGVAHEINNPLAVMLSEVGVMEDILDPEFNQEFNQEQFVERMNSIKSEIHRCKNITQKLLGFSRQHETAIDSHNLNTIVNDAVDLIRKELSFENIEIFLDMDVNLPHIRTDSEKIKQVLLNLIRNAKDAIGKDGRITISTHENQNSTSIIVSDTGQGISDEHLKKIFMPFFTTKAPGKGTGLGLSISHGIVTSLGGDINVASKLGKGTSFEIELPKKNPLT